MRSTVAFLSLVTDPSCLLIFSPHSQLWRFTSPVSSFGFPMHQNLILSSHLHRPVTRSRSSFSFGSGDSDEDEEEEEDGGVFGPGQRQRRRRKRTRRRWWSDEEEEMDQGSGVLEEVIDSIWIFKVFGSYGWMLPVIILSLLLTTGPKAFLTALALPIGQSLLTLAFDKLWGKTQNNPRRKVKSKWQRYGTPRNTELEEDGDDVEENQGSRSRKMGYQSWVSKDGQDGATFGGWDELDRSKEFANKSAKTAQKGLSRTPMAKGKFSRREGKSDTPLLLRLLIAVFPFLGSWTKML